MSTTYEPGTVAVATVGGKPNIRIFRTGTPSAMGWAFNHADGLGRSWVADGSISVTDVRPLVVLDLDPSACGWSSPEALIYDLRKDGYHRLSDQIETQTRPPRIPEPGLWGVVEATRGGPHRQSGRWVRIEAVVRPWQHSSGDYTANWDDLVDPVLIRDGIEDES